MHTFLYKKYKINKTGKSQYLQLFLLIGLIRMIWFWNVSYRYVVEHAEQCFKSCQIERIFCSLFLFFFYIFFELKF